MIHVLTAVHVVSRTPCAAGAMINALLRRGALSMSCALAASTPCHQPSSCSGTVVAFQLVGSRVLGADVTSKIVAAAHVEASERCQQRDWRPVAYALQCYAH